MITSFVCKECGNELRFEVKKFERGEVDYIVYPCQTCAVDCDDCDMILKDNPNYGECSECEELPPLKERIKDLEEELEMNQQGM
jgi:hypothetical protein